MFILLLVLSIGIPILGFIGNLLYFRKDRNALASSILSGVALSAMFYGYIPDSGNDIYRHIENLMYYQNIPIYECFDALKSVRITSVYTWDIYMWFISQLGNPYLLQAGAALGGYTIISFMTFDQVYRNEIKFKDWIIYYVLLLSAFPFLEVVMGIRSANAFIVSVLAIYLYYVRHMNFVISIALFIVSVFLHHGSLVLFLLWLFLPIINQYRKISLFVFIALLAFLSVYQNEFFSILSYDNPDDDIVASAINTSVVYQQGDFNDSFHAIFSISWRIVFSAFLMKIAYTYLRTIRTVTSQKILNYIFVVFVMSIWLLTALGNNGLRYIGVVDLLCTVLLLTCKYSFWSEEHYHIKLQTLLLLIMCFGCDALYLYDMNWGSGSVSSFFVSMLLGYMSRIS